jgi:hypothetical protein
MPATDSNPPFTAAGRGLVSTSCSLDDILTGLKIEREYAFQQWLKEDSGTPDSHRFLTRSETLKEVIGILEANSIC